MATADRVLSILRLFTMEQPVWTVDAAARVLDLSTSTAYQYFRSLIDAGLLAADKGGRYVVGPAVLSLDRVTRRHDPLVNAAHEAMANLVLPLDGLGVALLCRIFGSQVLCVDQLRDGATDFAISYERGRPMPLFRGSASKIILAHLPANTHRKLWETQTAEIALAGLGEDRESFAKTLRRIRRKPALVARGEIDRGLTGISAPVFFPENVVLGSLSVVVPSATLEARADLEASVVANVAKQAALLTEQLRS